MVNDKKNIHQTTWTRTTSSSMSYVDKDKNTTITTTTNRTETITTTIKVGEKGKADYSSSQLINEQTTRFEIRNKTIESLNHPIPGKVIEDVDSPFGKTEIVNSKSETNKNFVLSTNEQANEFASRIGNMMNANTEANPFNSSVSMVGDNLGFVSPILGGLQFLGKKLEISGTSKLGAYGLIYDLVGLGINLFRTSADHSGKTVIYDVDKDGNMNKQ